MIRDKNKFIETYNELCSSSEDVSSETIFSYTENYNLNKFESILDIEDEKLNNISFLCNKSQNFKMLSIGEIKNYTLCEYSKSNINDIIQELVNTTISINDTSQQNIPLIMCGQNYDINNINHNIWSDIPSLKYWVPRILLLDNENKTTITHLFNINKNVEEITSSIHENHKYIDELLKPNYSDSDSDSDTHSSKDIILNSRKFLIDKNSFKRSIEKIKDHINNSDVSKVVISNIISCDMDKNPSKSNIIIKLIDRYPTCTSFYYKYNETKYFIGASPEMILKKENDIINIDALAGSKSVENKNKLLNDNKILKEHGFVVQGIIDTLKKINLKSKIGEPYILELKNIAHLKTEIISKVDPKLNPLKILDSLVPTAALSGYPKHSSMEIINNIEENDRGWYAGPIGWIDSENNCEFYAALRSAYINNNKIYFYGGAGIVINSDHDEEWDEIKNKIDTIYNIINE